MKNPIHPTLKTEIVPLFFLLLSIILSFYFYAHFPETVATHWNTHGQANGYSSKCFAAFFFPVLNLGIYLLMLFLPMADPKRNNYKQFRHVYHIFKGVLIVFMSAIYFVTGLNGLGKNIPVNIVIPLGIGILFVVIGYFLKDIKPNWFIGIRTPWTLSSDRVWKKTHQFGSYIFIICGILLAASAFCPAWFSFFIILMLVLVVTIFIYSYYIYKK